MSEQKILRKKIVVPGELVTEERKRVGAHVFVENGKVYSDCLGIAYPDSETAAVIPLHGKYVPKRNDLIVGVIVSETFAGYIVDINSFYYSFVPKEMLREPLKKGSIISAKIVDVNEINEADLDDVRVFYGGEIVDMLSVKVPRVIGKEGSMLAIIKHWSRSNLAVGRNGRIWIKGGDVGLAVKAIKKIEAEAHMSNLTNTIEDFLKNEHKKEEGVKHEEER